MTKFNQDTPQFGSSKPVRAGESYDCVQCEAMLADALDGALSPEEQTRFDQHIAGCSACSQMLADAQRGAAWLEMLRTPRPEPPAALLERILMQTSGAPDFAGDAASLVLQHEAAELEPVRTGAKILPFRARVAAALHPRSLGHAALQPRLAMTAAMAFFSIGLTLNLAGVRLNELRASDLKPSSLRRTFYQANAHVIRYYDNLRVVYELESRVRDLQRSDDDLQQIPPASQQTYPSQTPPQEQKQAPEKEQQEHKQPRPRSGSGTSWRRDPSAVFSVVAAYRNEHIEQPFEPASSNETQENNTFWGEGELA